MKKALIRTLQAVFTIGLLIWLFYDPEKRAQMGRALTQAKTNWLIIGLPVAFVGEIANITRWQILLRVQGMYLNWKRATMLFFVGLFFNTFMPGYTGGDLARLFYLMREFPDKKNVAILTVVMDRLIGFLALIVTAAVTTLVRWQWLQRTQQASFLLWVLLVMLAGFVVVTAASFALSGLKLVHKLPRHFPLREMLIETSESYILFARSKRAILWAFALSFPVLFSFYGAFYCSAQAFRANVSLLDMCSIMPIVTVIISLPLSPSGLGVREQLFSVLLHDLCHVPGEVATLISILGGVYFYLFGLAGGVVYLFYSPRQQRARWREMQGEVERAHFTAGSGEGR
jgi:glycosyltransferase 2 family protein